MDLSRIDCFFYEIRIPSQVRVDPGRGGEAMDKRMVVNEFMNLRTVRANQFLNKLFERKLFEL